MAQWKHEYTEPPIDLRTYETDWRVPVDMALVGLGYELDRIQALLVKDREAEYLCQLDNAALLMSRLTKLQLLCSVVRERRSTRTLQAAE